ncbi:MAG: hypothetical protein JKY15_01155 [Deltaproteobacteria bacterium]|nr:hypothetical protein [Deltaproteobacteria bacterium]
MADILNNLSIELEENQKELLIKHFRENTDAGKVMIDETGDVKDLYDQSITALDFMIGDLGHVPEHINGMLYPLGLDPLVERAATYMLMRDRAAIPSYMRRFLEAMPTIIERVQGVGGGSVQAGAVNLATVAGRVAGDPSNALEVVFMALLGDATQQTPAAGGGAVGSSRG